MECGEGRQGRGTECVVERCGEELEEGRWGRERGPVGTSELGVDKVGVKGSVWSCRFMFLPL